MHLYYYPYSRVKTNNLNGYLYASTVREYKREYEHKSDFESKYCLRPAQHGVYTVQMGAANGDWLTPQLPQIPIQWSIFAHPDDGTRTKRERNERERGSSFPLLHHCLDLAVWKEERH